MAVVATASGSAQSSISNAPAVLLMEGKPAEMNDMVRHPLVVDFDQQLGVSKPVVHTFEDGLQLQLQAVERPGTDPLPPGIDLTCRITAKRLLDIETDQVFGLDDESLMVQVPLHQVTTAAVNRRLSADQTLLVDPHVRSDAQIETKTGVPVIGQLPYVGRTFQNTRVESVKQYLIVLLRTAVHPTKDPDQP